MADLAIVSMTGRLTRNPEQFNVENKTALSKVSKFSIAVNGFKNHDVSFFDCEAWGKLSEIIQQYCQKGKQIAVSGTIRIDRWEDKDGNKRSKPVVNVRDMTLLGSKDDSAPSEPSEPSEPVQEEEDDVPF
jgi:single-strand DNA-binding protein